jgi:hypothetical protein
VVFILSLSLLDDVMNNAWIFTSTACRPNKKNIQYVLQHQEVFVMVEKKKRRKLISAKQMIIFYSKIYLNRADRNFNRFDPPGFGDLKIIRI